MSKTQIDYSYACDLCTKTSFSQTGLKLHLLRVHKVDKQLVDGLFCMLFSMNDLIEKKHS